jgi:hypothetical protein
VILVNQPAEDVNPFDALAADNVVTVTSDGLVVCRSSADRIAGRPLAFARRG